MEKHSLESTKVTFFVDGSLRDIYILGTTQEDWQKLLIFLHTSSYSVEFIVADELRALPESIEEVFVLVHKHGGMLRVMKRVSRSIVTFTYTTRLSLILIRVPSPQRSSSRACWISSEPLAIY